MAANSPKLLRAMYLADTEGLLRETRATVLFYLPGPLLWLILALLGLWSALGLRYGWAGIGPVTDAWRRLTNSLGGSSVTYLITAFEILALLLALWLLIRYLRWISTVYAVTTHRVIIQRGIFSRDFDEIPIPQVRGVDVHQRIFQRMLGYGTVRVSSEAGSRLGNEDWEGIPKPFEFQRLIEAANQAITRTTGSGPGRSL